MTTAGNATRQPIGVLEHVLGLVNPQLKLTDYDATGPKIQMYD